MQDSVWNLIAQVGPPHGIRGVLVSGKHGGWVDAQGSSRGLSGPADLWWLLFNRATAQAVIVSFGTATRENYRSGWMPRQAELQSVRGYLELEGPPVLVVVSDNDQRRKSAHMSDFAVSFDDLPSLLSEQGLTSAVCEGGPRLIDRLAAAGRLAELALTVSPHEAGPSVNTPALEAWVEKAVTRHEQEADGFLFRLLTSNDSDHTQQS